MCEQPKWKQRYGAWHHYNLRLWELATTSERTPIKTPPACIRLPRSQRSQLSSKMHSERIAATQNSLKEDLSQHAHIQRRFGRRTRKKMPTKTSFRHPRFFASFRTQAYSTASTQTNRCAATRPDTPPHRRPSRVIFLCVRRQGSTVAGYY